MGAMAQSMAYNAQAMSYGAPAPQQPPHQPSYGYGQIPQGIGQGASGMPQSAPQRMNMSQANGYSAPSALATSAFGAQGFQSTTYGNASYSLPPAQQQSQPPMPVNQHMAQYGNQQYGASSGAWMRPPAPAPQPAAPPARAPYAGVPSSANPVSQFQGMPMQAGSWPAAPASSLTIRPGGTGLQPGSVAAPTLAPPPQRMPPQQHQAAFQNHSQGFSPAPASPIKRASQQLMSGFSPGPASSLQLPVAQSAYAPGSPLMANSVQLPASIMAPPGAAGPRVLPQSQAQRPFVPQGPPPQSQAPPRMARTSQPCAGMPMAPPPMRGVPQCSSPTGYNVGMAFSGGAPPSSSQSNYGSPLRPNGGSITLGQAPFFR